MKTLCFWGLSLAVASVPSLLIAQTDSRGMQMSPGATAAQTAGSSRNWGNRVGGRWIGGARAPGGYNGYRPAVRGYILPRYWTQPSFFIGNYARYNFSTPRSGYGWSRYYDDAVLTDRNGRVYDSVRDVDWDRYDAYDDSDSEDYSDSYGYRDDGYSRDGRTYRGDEYRGSGSDNRDTRDRDSGLGGAVIGGVVGAVAGNVIGGRGNRLAGSLIGGGVGALAGSVIDKNDRAGRGARTDRSTRDNRYDDRDYGYDDRRGSMSQGAQPHWSRRDDYNYPQYRDNRQPPRYGYTQHYSYPAETIVTFQSAPVVTTTTYVTEEVTYAAAKRRHVARKRVWKPRHKARCTC